MPELEITQRIEAIERKQDLIISLLRKQTAIIDDEYIDEVTAASSFNIKPATLRRKVLNNEYEIRTTKPGKQYMYHQGDILKVKDQNSNRAA